MKALCNRRLVVTLTQKSNHCLQKLDAAVAEVSDVQHPALLLLLLYCPEELFIRNLPLYPYPVPVPVPHPYTEPVHRSSLAGTARHLAKTQHPCRKVRLN